MIKGVNRQVVEVRETGCDYFEKIERASLIAGDTPLPPPTKTPDNRVTGILKILLSSLCGLAAGLTISFLIR